ncbi:hypothetical protein M9Y10_011372 [Tritrichomonas musculus]|uniref:Uncharacterized protein n=1 Tax=Tritrichomonas musculus TaxID=1915356 RepID=A0ABR2IKL6_9EUKA
MQSEPQFLSPSGSRDAEEPQKAQNESNPANNVFTLNEINQDSAIRLVSTSTDSQIDYRLLIPPKFDNVENECSDEIIEIQPSHFPKTKQRSEFHLLRDCKEGKNNYNGNNDGEDANDQDQKKQLLKNNLPRQQNSPKMQLERQRQLIPRARRLNNTEDSSKNNLSNMNKRAPSLFAKFIKSNEDYSVRSKRGLTSFEKMDGEEKKYLQKYISMFKSWDTAYKSAKSVWNEMKSNDTFDCDALLSQISAEFGDFLIGALRTFADIDGYF